MSSQPTTPFAKAHKQSVATMRDMWKAADDATYGEMPKYDENPIGWTSRMRAQMATSHIMKRAGLGTKDMNTRNILADTMARLEEQYCMGDENAAWSQLRKEVKAHIHHRRRMRDDNARYAAKRKESIEYGKSLGMTDSEISSQLILTPRGLNYAERCKIVFDSFVMAHPRKTEKSIRDTFDKTKETAVSDLNDTLTAVADDQAAQDELTKVNWNKFWESVRNAAHDLPVENIHNYTHAFFGNVSSVKDVGKTPNVMLAEIGQHFSKVRSGKAELLSLKVPDLPPTENATKKADEPTSSQTSTNNSVALKTVPESGTKKAIVESETKPVQHLLKVYPANFGSVIHRGYKFSVTLCSDDATWDDAIRLMNIFVDNAIISDDCKVQAQPANVASVPAPSNITQMTPPAPAPVPSAAPATNGSGSYPIAEVKKVVDEGKTRIELFSRAGDEKPAGAVRTAGDIAIVVFLVILVGLTVFMLFHLMLRRRTE